MNFKLGPSPNIHGCVVIPPNKSHSFRALLFAALAEGTSQIHHPAESNDWLLGIEAMELFGARIEPHRDGRWEVQGVGGTLRTPDDVLSCGNSGIILRFFTALASCCQGWTVLTGDESLRHIRPMQPVLDAINALGGEAISTKQDGKAPLLIRGPIRPGTARLDGTDSQWVSAMLIAAALTDGETILEVENPGELPWVDMTLYWLARMGVTVDHTDYRRYRIQPGSEFAPMDYTVPRDWSAALYPIAAGVLTADSEVRVSGMDFDDCQGDKTVVDILRSMGADIEIAGDTVIAKSSSLTGREIDCNGCIDQLPLLAVIGAAATGETVLTNAAICRQKECDRIAATCETLRAMGADIEERPDGLVVRQSTLHGADLSSYHDHRMVMSMSVAALLASGTTTIRDAECVKKTFPHFGKEMAKLGCDIQQVSS